MDVLREELMLAVHDHTYPDLPMIAARALARGVDSPSLREVAGLGRTDPAAEDFSRALSELGLAWPTEDEAHLYAARRICAGLLLGDLAPTEAVEKAEAVYHHLCSVATAGGGRYDYLGFLQVTLKWESATAGGSTPTPDERRLVVERTRELASELLAETDPGPGPGGPRPV